MARYDRSYDRGYGARRPRIWGRGEAYFEHDDAEDLGRPGPQGWARPGGRWWARPGEPADFGRGTYGGDYPGFGGYPGSGREGIHYGSFGGGRQGQPTRYGAEYGGGFARGYDRGYDRGLGAGRARQGGYGGDFARAPFMPEAAYLRHPEYETPSTYHQQRWERPGEYVTLRDEPLGDEEIRREVRQRLYQDTWLRADDIEVTVDDGVVTLRGEVGDFLEARYAWDDAWETDGVRGVINNLTVRADEPQSPHGDAFSQDAG